MSLKYFDGLDFYSATGDLATAHISNVTAVPYTSGGRFGGGRVDVAGSNYLLVCNPWVYTPAASIFQFAYKHSTGVGSNGRVAWIYLDGSGKVKLNLTATGALQLVNAAGVTVATSASGLIRAGVWHYFEIKCISDDAGTFVCKVDGLTIFSYLGTIDTYVSTSKSIYGIEIGGGGSGTASIDDVLFMDDTGSAPCNDFIGDCRITQLLPNADTAEADWLKSTGTSGYAMVDDTVPGIHDGDSTYLYSNVIGDLSLFEVGAMATSPITIFAIQSSIVAKKTTTDDRTIRTVLKSNVTTSNGATDMLTTAYYGFTDIWEQDPDTAAAWIKAGVDAVQVGIETVS